MRLYDCRTAPSPRRVRIFIAEKDIDAGTIESIEIDLAGKQQFSDAFRKVNPDCVVPVLELGDGTCLSEVMPICYYLDAKFPEPTLFGSTDEARAKVLMWNSKIEQQGLLPMAEAFRNKSRGLIDRAVAGPVAYAQIPELAERARVQVQRFFEKLDAQLANSEYVVGDQFSIADISALVTIDFAAWIKLSLPDSASNARRWHASVSSRPSVSA